MDRAWRIRTLAAHSQDSEHQLLFQKAETEGYRYHHQERYTLWDQHAGEEGRYQRDYITYYFLREGNEG